MSDLATMLSFPPEKKKKDLSIKDYDKEMTSYIKSLSGLSQSAWTKNVEKKNILEMLDPAVNSIPYLVSLNRQLDANANDVRALEQLYQHIELFFTSFDPVQVRYVGEEWRNLFTTTYELLQNDRSDNISLLVNALLRLDPTAGTFTTNHLRIVRLALRNEVPSQALPIIDRDIYAFPQKAVKGAPDELLSDEHELSNAYITYNSKFSQPISTEYVLEYYLLGAHIYIGMRNFHRARLFLEHVILSPTQQHAVSALQVEAYKKWVLIGLLAQGRAYPAPKTVDPSVYKSIQVLAKPYDALSDDFDKRDYKKWNAEVEVAANIWQDDGNLRLVREAGEALMRYRVLDLQKTYAALSIARVAQLVDMRDTEAIQLLQQMIQGGHLNADLSSTDGVLRFNETSVAPTAADDDLEGQTQRITTLVASIRDADRRLQLTKEYVDYAKRIKRSGDAVSGDPADMMDLSYDAPIVDDDGDEDLMNGGF
ncbi:COP9 signalosome complex subunit 3 [Fulvia fulva]|uniref:COP9 signalosome complex subunit 3 n=1 Tax=Passalora fulva TaxID=5499 RepID=A0A9Q8UTD9_PASFU|nr:COP9 signalosome complex subunit 3 [Fulvia fulva]UJO21713.1 COP9 signalosome complex subunit 3 [Fulvia fulva]